MFKHLEREVSELKYGGSHANLGEKVWVGGGKEFYWGFKGGPVG